MKVSIFGASGYTGLELLRILAMHPEAEVIEATSRQYKGKKIPEVFPSLRGFYDNLAFSDLEDVKSVKVGHRVQRHAAWRFPGDSACSS